MVNIIGAAVVLLGLAIRLAYRKTMIRARPSLAFRATGRSYAVGPAFSDRLSRYRHPR